MPNVTSTTRSTLGEPLKKLAKASKGCTKQSLAYGACIGKSYLDVSKGMCQPEFEAFKACVQTQMGRKW